MFKSIFTVCIFLQTTICSFAEIINYKAPNCTIISKAYQVKIKEAGSAWQRPDVYYANVAHSVNNRMAVKHTSYTYFDCSAKVNVSVTVNNAKVKSVKIRPAAYGIVSQIHGNTITFSMDASQFVSVEINGNILENLQVFANAIDTERPTSGNADLIYFGPGIHEIGRMLLPSNKKVYISGGAIVHGSFIVDHAENVKIFGRGILTQLNVGQEFARHENNKSTDSVTTRKDAILVQYSKNVEISGIIVIPHKYSVLIGQSENVSIKDLKSFSSEGNADGIDVFCSKDILLDHVFMRNSDDCVAVYGHRWDYYGNVKNLTVSNSILWADVAHPILVGTHGDSKNPDTLENIKFKNIIILNQHENQIDYQGCMSLNAGDSNLLRDIRFENIAVESISKGQLINIRVMFNHKYNTSPGDGIENVYFKNIHYAGKNANMSIIAGYDEKRGIKNITFENLKIADQIISDDMVNKPSFYKTGDMADIFVGEHVEGLRFIKTE